MRILKWVFKHAGLSFEHDKLNLDLEDFSNILISDLTLKWNLIYYLDKFNCRNQFFEDLLNSNNRDNWIILYIYLKYEKEDIGDLENGTAVQERFQESQKEI